MREPLRGVGGKRKRGDGREKTRVGGLGKRGERGRGEESHIAVLII